LDDRVGRCDDPRIDAILDPDVTGGIHDSTTHFLRSPDLELITMGWTTTLLAPQPLDDNHVEVG
jgi:hypothetical protein